MSVLRNSGDQAKGDQKGRKGGAVGDSSVFKIVRMLMDRKLAPVIVFSFSKRECEEHAKCISKLDFNDGEQVKELLCCMFYSLFVYLNMWEIRSKNLNFPMGHFNQVNNDTNSLVLF